MDYINEMISNGRRSCPHCVSDNIAMLQELEFDHRNIDELMLFFYCRECDGEWEEYYRLYGSSVDAE
jgi:hypothetical protein